MRDSSIIGYKAIVIISTFCSNIKLFTGNNKKNELQTNPWPTKILTVLIYSWNHPHIPKFPKTIYIGQLLVLSDSLWWLSPNVTFTLNIWNHTSVYFLCFVDTFVLYACRLLFKSRRAFLSSSPVSSLGSSPSAGVIDFCKITVIINTKFLLYQMGVETLEEGMEKYESRIQK